MRAHFVGGCALLAAVGSFTFSGCGGDATSPGETTVASAPTPPPTVKTKSKSPYAKVKLMPGAPAGAVPKPAN